MKPKLLSALTAAAAVVLLTVAACGSSGGKSDQQPTNASESGSTSLSVYTSEPDSDINAMITAFNKKYPNIKVGVYRSGTEEVVSKIEAENQAGTNKADVAFLADSLTMENLASEGLLQKYTAPNASDIDSKYMDPNGYYEGTKIIATGIAINTNNVKTNPDSWDILTSSEAKDKAEMPSPLYSGAAAFNVTMFASNDAFGWDYWKKVASNGMKVVKGNGSVLTDVANGDRSYGMVVDFIVARAAAEGSPVKFIYPKEGVPYITEPIAIMKDAPNPDAAKKFTDFVFSDAGQAVESQLGYVPLKPGAPVPDGLQGVKNLKLMSPGDLQALAAKVPDAKKQFQSIFGS